MSYEYKKSIKHDLETLNQLREVTDWRVDEEIGEKQTELDHVYSQASKADEYEAKAKAFDRIVEQRKKTGVITLGHHAWEIIRELESGGYDAEKR